MDFKTFAEKELLVLGYTEESVDPRKAKIRKDLMDLIEVFDKQEHTPQSAGLISLFFHKLANFQILSPVVNMPKDWLLVDEANDLYTHSRLSALFKVGKEGRPYYLNAIIWRDQEGHTHSGWASSVRSRQYVREWPFSPRTFFVDVTSVPQEDGTFNLEINNTDDLKAVWEVYDYYDPNMDVLDQIEREA